MITVILNSKPQSVSIDDDLSSFIQSLDIDTQGTALAVNNTIIPRSKWQGHLLNEGDCITLFQAIAGG